MNTLNAGPTLRRALESLESWVDELVVVDMYSDDDTRLIARECGAIVYSYPRVGYVEPAREYAVAKSSGDWIMLLDADEVVPHQLALRLLEMSRVGTCDAISIPMANIIFGKSMVGGGFGPEQDRHVRFFRRGSITFQSAIHSHPRICEGCRLLDLPFEGHGTALIHFSHPSPLSFVQKTRRYAPVEARGQVPNDLRHRHSLVWRWASAARVFYQRYVVMRGYRDGLAGFTLAVLMGHYRWVLRQERDALQRKSGNGLSR